MFMLRSSTFAASTLQFSLQTIAVVLMRSSMDKPFVFLTSNSGSVPSGRNARAIARSVMFQGEGRSPSAQGTFHVFATTNAPQGMRTRQATRPSSPLARQGSHRRSTGGNPPDQRADGIPRILGPQSITIENILATATARIRIELNSIVRNQPSLVRDVVRRTMWATATFASGTLYLTQEVHSAVKYLEHMILTTTQSREVDHVGLQKYGVALTELQRSLRDPERRMQPSVLAASHILAVCELLCDTTSDKYLNFIGGIVAISNLQACKGDVYARDYVRSRAGGIMIEALLAKRSNAVLDQSWPQILVSAGDNGHISPEDAVSFSQSADLIFGNLPITKVSMDLSISGSDKVEAVTKARTLHSVIKSSTQNDLQSSNTSKHPCSNVVRISECLAVMLGLDDFIIGIAEAGESPSVPTHGVNNSFYAEIMCAA